MKLYNILLLLFCMIVSVVGQRVKKQSKDDQNCNENDFDRHSSNVFGQFGLEELRLPESKNELKTYCRKAKESTDFAKKFGDNCLKGTSQTLMSLASYNFDKVNKDYCAKNGKKKDQWIEWAKCGNKAKPATIKCWDKMIITMANTKKVKNNKIRIPIICCSYYAWINCNRKAFEAMGSNVCSDDAINGIDVHTKKASVDSMNLICSRYQDDLTKCQSYEKEVSNTRPKRIHKTPLLYVFEVFDSL
ncbi:uncharacterized protein LOC128963984 [Oppia nitens]|uniref:uncharacterized protein LOC128963984 n=1 Tax=Oppia nitens TaxID=1686743 RepID=UPI0023DCA608|nr:uncharacterized protein LOC128963984 [Oppia nitens]